MALAGRVHTLAYDTEWNPDIAELSAASREDRMAMQSSFRSLRAIYAELDTLDAFLAITTCCITPALQTLSLSLDWDNSAVQDISDTSLIDEAHSLLSTLHTSSPLLENFRMLIQTRSGWDRLSFSTLPHFTHLRRLEVSLEMLPHIWSAAAKLPLLNRLTAVHRARREFASEHQTVIHPFPRGGFSSLETLSLQCSWTSAQLLFPQSMDLTSAPMLHTLVLTLPIREEASGYEFQRLLHRMQPLHNQIRHLLFTNVASSEEMYMDVSYAPLSAEDLVGLRSFGALRQLTFPTEEAYGLIHELIGDPTIHPQMEICTIYRPGRDSTERQSQSHTILLDPLSCKIVRYHYPAIIHDHLRVMDSFDSNPGRLWRIEPPLVAYREIGPLTISALRERFPVMIYSHGTLNTQTYQFGRLQWWPETELRPELQSQ